MSDALDGVRPMIGRARPAGFADTGMRSTRPAGNGGNKRSVFTIWILDPLCRRSAWMLVHVLAPVAIVLVAIGFAVGLRRFSASRVVRERVPGELLETIAGCRGPLVALVLVFMLRAYQPIFESSLHFGTRGTMLNVAMMLILGWLAVAISRVLVALLHLRLAGRFASDPERVRRIHTQLTVFRAVIAAIIWLATAIFIMLTFPATRPIATSLFASASLLSLVVGIAAQGTLGSMFAGLQIAFGDVVRIGDMVVVDGQRGMVEELALTYVVVRLLDYRRLVVPVTFFTTKPFENWTRIHPGVKSETHINLDLAAPVPTIRTKVADIIENSPL
ncbi:mechanosensitive ion channel [Nocardia seriolae]|nr:mechanosensitive ion channel [Nocardia seriolae]MTJ72741.1 mechanosensitive ion channel [Nocardia seriolae]MTJ90489.1 mechanosensitive ion channel [Nocardia seriolae]MTK34449.1 mechanosensitive ion channel [Nocardia seriolae]MTK43603.1 mechanosensitive ion channel [Nocardia seriolae]